jgi:outer membrane protein TolC
MLRSKRQVAIQALSLLLAGCATTAIEMAPDRADRPWTPRVDAAGEIVAGEKPAAATAQGASYVLPPNSRVADLPPPLAPDHVQPGQEHVYSLPELIDIAQSNNPLTRVAWNNAREVALAAGIARSAYLPRLSASVIGGRQSSHDHSSVSGISVDNDVTADGAISALSLQWLLFDFGERAAINNAADQASVISNIAFDAAHQQVVYEVSLTFYAHAAARARVDAATRSLRNAKEVQEAAEQRRAHDVGTVIEVSQARQATAQATLVKVQAEGAAENSYQALIGAIGVSPLTRLRIADIADRKLPAAVPDSLEHIISEALGRRPDVLTAYAAQRASEESIRAARAAFLPKFFLSATGAYNSGHLDVTSIPSIGEQLPTVNLSEHRYGTTIFAGVTMPIYDGGTRAARLRQAEAKADSASTVLLRTREDAVRQIVVAANTLRTSLSANDAATALAAAAQTTFDAALASYRNGVGSITDVTIAESQLLQAQTISSDAHSAALSSAATFALAAGALGSAPQ